MTPTLLRSVADLLDEADVKLAKVATYTGREGVNLTVTWHEALVIAALTGAKHKADHLDHASPYSVWEGQLDGYHLSLYGDHVVTA